MRKRAALNTRLSHAATCENSISQAEIYCNSNRNPAAVRTEIVAIQYISIVTRSFPSWDTCNTKTGDDTLCLVVHKQELPYVDATMYTVSAQ